MSKHQILRGVTAPKVNTAHATKCQGRYPPHLRGDLVDLRDDVDREGRGAIRIAQSACIAELIADVRMRALAAGYFEVRFRCVHSDRHTTALRQRYCDYAGAAPDIEHPLVGSHLGKVEERAC